MDLSGEVLTGRELGYTVVLLTSGGYTITIENSLALETGSGTHHVAPDPGIANELAARLQPLMNQRIAAANADPSGGLDISFDDGTQIHVEPSEEYEAWTVSGPGGQLAVSQPGGQLAEWSGDAAG